MVTGDQLAVLWQLSQLLELAMWFADLPTAFVPLWQLAQPEVTPAWSKVAEVQLPVE